MRLPHAGTRPFIWRLLPGGILTLLYFAIVAAETVAVVRANGGVFGYTLDDPFIHLRLSEMIGRFGSYGINPGEPASPSSSILWPLLLVPFVFSPAHVYMPLLLNTIAGVGEIVLLGMLVTRVRGPVATMREGLLRTLLLPLGFFALNPIGLTMMGMEHELQIVATLAAAIVTVDAASGRRGAGLLLALTVIGPFVRYENLVPTGLALLMLGLNGRMRLAIALGALIGIGLAAFSAFLMAMGLDPLPSSVITKTAGTGPFTIAHWKSLLVYAVYVDPMPLAVLLGIPGVAVWAVWACRRADGLERRHLLLIIAILAAVAVHLAFGKFGWFFRYEVYAVAFTMALGFAVVFDLRTPNLLRAGLFLALVAATGVSYARSGLGDTACAARAIYGEPGQLARLSHEFLPGPVAVVDVGMVSYRNTQPVLDLWGLGSNEAMRARLSGQRGWVAGVVAHHPIDYAMVFTDGVLADEIPADWRQIGTLRLTAPLCSLLKDKVGIFAVKPGIDATLRQAVASWAASLPDSTVFEPAS